ncbi:MAG: glutamate formimidoyltransferase [Deltaproteobacteria bacterium]|nr:MAG: glutamate formimidoyltransferase [Deltaproteobacteria bacterium]PIE73668.1 MAG: glutamate formimidoyltransferase [Deltaproteobacteria bacterium]
MKALMCVPNISEGRDLELVEQVVDKVRKTPGVRLLDYSSDGDHNRSVISYIGAPEAVVSATKDLVSCAVELIDMSKHTGSHPRQGAVDVVPFIPVRDIETEESIEIARTFGKWVGETHQVPVYFYEDAAIRTDRVSLPKVRKGQYEALEEKLKDEFYTPDAGPCKFVPKTGSIQVSSRFPLIALNINLNSTDVEMAINIAKSVRHINGGFRYVRGMGLALEEENQVQVSMNLINYMKTPIPMVMEAVRREAARYGVNVVKSELVGPVPMGAMAQTMSYYLQAHDLSLDQVLENSLIGWSGE